MRYASLLSVVAYATLSFGPIYAADDREHFYAFLEKNFSNILPVSFLPSKGAIFMSTSGEGNTLGWVGKCMSDPGEDPYRLVVHYFHRIGQTRNTEKLRSVLTETQSFAQKNPKFFWAQYVYTVNLLKLGDTERFKEQIQKMMRMEPEDFYGYLILEIFGLVMEDIKYVDDLFKKAVKKYPNVSMIFHEYGVFLEKHKQDLDGAARQYLKAISIDGYKQSYLDLAGLYAAQDRYEEAIEVYDAALSRYPSDINFLRSKGIILAIMGRASEGIPLIEEAIKKDPKDGKTYWLLGMAHKAIKEKDKACAAFVKAVELGYEDADEYLKGYCK